MKIVMVDTVKSQLKHYTIQPEKLVLSRLLL